MDIKGMAIAIFEPFIVEKFGRVRYEKWLEALDPEARTLLSGPIKSDSWYPLRTAYSHPTEVLCRLFYDGDPKGAWELGRYSADQAFNWVYKSVIKLTTINSFITRLHLIDYYRPVAVQSISAVSGKIVYRITEFADINVYIEHRIAGWNQRALEIHDCRGVRVEIPQSLARGDPYTEFDITWQEG